MVKASDRERMGYVAPLGVGTCVDHSDCVTIAFVFVPDPIGIGYVEPAPMSHLPASHRFELLSSAFQERSLSTDRSTGSDLSPVRIPAAGHEGHPPSPCRSA